MIPAVHFSVGGSNLPLADWQTTMLLGGYDRLSGTCLASEARSLPDSVTQGSTVTAYDDTGAVVWEGRLASDPHFQNGTGRVEAIGHKSRLEKEDERLLFQSRDVSGWTVVSDTGISPPGINTVAADIDAEVRNAVLFFRAPKESIPAGAQTHICFWAAGAASISRYAFEILKNRDNASFSIRTTVFTGPTGSATVEQNHNLAGGQPTTIDVNVATASKDGLSFGLRNATAGAVTPGNPLTVRLKSLRVNGIAPGDTYTAQQVLQHISTQVGFDNRGIAAALSMNALPLDWQDSWASLADYVTAFSDGWWRVLEDRGSGPYVEANTWANSKVWTVRQSRGARVDLVPLEKFNVVQVNYENVSGALRRKRATASPDPLASVGLTNVYEFDLEDPQGDDTLAGFVADALLPQVSTDRYSGQIEFVEARDETGRNAPREVKAGDLITVEDHDAMQSFTHRVAEVTQTKDGVVAQVGEEPSALQTIALFAYRFKSAWSPRSRARQRR